MFYGENAKGASLQEPLSSMPNARARAEPLIVDPLILEVAVQMVVNNIERGSHNVSEARLESRRRLLKMAEVLPLVCKTFRDAAREDKRHAYVVFYERCRLNNNFDSSFLEGVPQTVPFFTGHVPDAARLPSEALLDLRSVECIGDRVSTVLELEATDNESVAVYEHMLQLHVHDLTPGLPNRVHALVSRMRALSQGLRQVRPQTWFRQCQNQECNRLYFAGPEEARPSTDEPSYWDIVCGGEVSPEPRTESFCCSACHVQYSNQLRAAMPKVALDQDVSLTSQGRARVLEGFRRAIRRNRDISRHIRTVQKQPQIYTALGTTFDTLKERYIRMLNIDLGLLYCASVCAESAAMSNGRILPGMAPHWRTRPVFFSRPIQKVQDLFERCNAKSHILYNMGLDEPFFQKLSQQAHRLF